MRNVAFIPARGGSRRIPRKNIREFCGKPIIAYSIQVAQNSGWFDEIVVSSDDDEILRVAVGYGANTHRRSEVMARDEVGTQAVAADYLSVHGIDVDVFAVIYPCAPLIIVGDLDLACTSVANGECEYSYTVAYPLHDVGQFYVGKRESYLKGKSLTGSIVRLIDVGSSRDCDINTESDWERALTLYNLMRGGDGH